jgi:Ca2+-transporting ATPase
MGVTGSDVSKEAANMILVDDNFATIVSAVRQGRSIFANVRRCLRYLLSSANGRLHGARDRAAVQQLELAFRA